MATPHCATYPLPVPEAVQLFRLLSDPGRLRMLRLLAERHEVCVGDLAGAIGLSQPAVSIHLQRLRFGGVVECRRQGKHSFYRLCSPLAADLLAGVGG